jgi:hypothetical protein
MPGVNGHNPQAYLGSWKNWDAVSGNISGTWRTSSDVYVNHNGTWKQVWVRLTGPTGGSTSLSDVTATISWTAGVGQEGFKLYRNGTFVKNVTSGTSTTDVVPTMQANHVYTVSAYAGATETAQIACGTVRAEVGTPVATVTIERNWTYVSDSWDGQQIQFYTTSSAVSNANASYQTSLGGGTAGILVNHANAYSTIYLNANETTNSRWRAVVTHNSVQYFGEWSNTVNITAGRPQIRTARTDDYPVEAWADQERYTVSGIGVFDRLDTTYIANSAIVDSYQFRNLSINFGSQITSSTRSIVMSKPGTNITLSGSPFVSNGYNSSVFTDYVDQRYRIDPQGAGWFNFNNASKLTGTIRFNIRFISQTAIAFTIA